VRGASASFIASGEAAEAGFGAWPVGSKLHWFGFPGAARLLSGEGDPTAPTGAETFAAILAEAGLPTLAQIAIPAFVRALVAGEYALLMGWEPVGWDIDKLSIDPELCALTAAAMADAVGVVTVDEAGAAERILASMPPLEQRVALMNDNMRAIWRFHGPKIAMQNEARYDTSSRRELHHFARRIRSRSESRHR
jgi:hypothetical protein